MQKIDTMKKLSSRLVNLKQYEREILDFIIHIGLEPISVDSVNLSPSHKVQILISSDGSYQFRNDSHIFQSFILVYKLVFVNMLNFPTFVCCTYFNNNEIFFLKNFLSLFKVLEILYY